jgi:ribosomal-protein-alanine N-acetyltransferase
MDARMADAAVETELRTERLRLRHFRPEDASAFLALAGDYAVARMTSDIPHPLTAAEVGPWLRREPGEERFAIEYQGQLAGGVGYFPRDSGAAELGFWIGRHLWNAGLATEAVREVVRYGFAEGGIRAFSSSRFIDNPGSERVLLKTGFKPVGEGVMWCTARKSLVATVEYRLSRPAGLGRDVPASRSRWGVLGKVLKPRQR